MKKHTKIILQYLITFIVETIIFGIIILLRGITEAEDFGQRLVIVCDGFFITGVLFASLGALIVISKGGFFDILGYGVKSLGVLFLPKKLKNVEHYYEYHERKKLERSNKTSLVYILIDGLIFIVFAFLCFLV